jgi:hypothetical protein
MKKFYWVILKEYCLRIRFIYIYIYIYIHIHIYVYICIYMYVHTHIHTYTHTHIYAVRHMVPPKKLNIWLFLLINLFLV